MPGSGYPDIRELSWRAWPSSASAATTRPRPSSSASPSRRPRSSIASPSSGGSPSATSCAGSSPSASTTPTSSGTARAAPFTRPLPPDAEVVVGRADFVPAPGARGATVEQAAELLQTDPRPCARWPTPASCRAAGSATSGASCAAPCWRGSAAGRRPRPTPSPGSRDDRLHLGAHRLRLLLPARGAQVDREVVERGGELLVERRVARGEPTAQADHLAPRVSGPRSRRSRSASARASELSACESP